MSKRVQIKIKEKHPDVKKYTELNEFQFLMQNTVAFTPYHKCEDTMNFIVYIDNKFVLYALKREKHHTSCNTIYALNVKTLKKLYKQENFKIMKKEYVEIIKRYILPH